jgi:hypothetical protein
MSYPISQIERDRKMDFSKCHGHRSTTSTIDAAAVAMRDMSKQTGKD